MFPVAVKTQQQRNVDGELTFQALVVCNWVLVTRNRYRLQGDEGHRYIITGGINDFPTEDGDTTGFWLGEYFNEEEALIVLERFDQYRQVQVEDYLNCLFYTGGIMSDIRPRDCSCTTFYMPEPGFTNRK